MPASSIWQSALVNHCAAFLEEKRVQRHVKMSLQLFFVFFAGLRLGLTCKRAYEVTVQLFDIPNFQYILFCSHPNGSLSLSLLCVCMCVCVICIKSEKAVTFKKKLAFYLLAFSIFICSVKK